MDDPKLDLAAARRDLSLMAATATDLDDDAEDRCLDVHLPAALARVEELEAKLRSRDEEIEASDARILSLRAELERLRTALEVYADEENWKMGGRCDPVNGPPGWSEENFETIAQNALSGGKEETDG